MTTINYYYYYYYYLLWSSTHHYRFFHQWGSGFQVCQESLVTYMEKGGREGIHNDDEDTTKAV